MTETLASKPDAMAYIRSKFNSASIAISTIEVREYPEETIFIVYVAPDSLANGATLGNQIDAELSSAGISGFVTVRPATKAFQLEAAPADSEAITTEKSTELVRLLSERARTSLIQPSLSYIPDTAANISRAVGSRHNLIFGRRGAGKTSLLLEVKRIIEKQGHLGIWVNFQTLRNSDTAARPFLWIVQKLCEEILLSFKGREATPKVGSDAANLLKRVETMFEAPTLSEIDAERLVPSVQGLVARYVGTTDRRIYFFLDDFYYLPRIIQPCLLDLIHGCVRDCDAWLKVATIKHLTRWFQPSPPKGLQTGHDADLIDLDLTLQDPVRAKQFLEEVLRTYAHEVGIPLLSRIFSVGALDRLVLASGAVPRDYLVLAGSSITQARTRDNARVVGQTDVNKAAGIAAQAKIAELEEDAASTEGTTVNILRALNDVRRFCLDEKKYTYFRIDYRDREKHAVAYAILQGLMDLRLVHLVNSSLSDEHHAGERSEVYMLDLSQFSGHRLKKNLRVLDFTGGHLTLSATGTKIPKKTAITANQLLAILRRGPQFPLESIAPAAKSSNKRRSNPPA